MKRTLTLVLALVMLVSLLAGCAGNGGTTTTAATTAAAADATTAAATTAAATTAAAADATTAAAPETTAAPEASGTWDTGSIVVEPLGIDLEGAEVTYSTQMGVLNEERNKVWEKAMQYTNEIYNGNVTYSLVDSAEYNSKMKTLLASGMGPDIFNAGQADFVAYVAGDALLDLTDYIPQYMPKMFAKVSDELYKAVTYDGRIFAMIPFKDLVANHSLLYDGSQVEAAGLEVPDWTRYTDLKELLYQMRDWMDSQGRQDDVVASLFPEFWRDAAIENIGNNSDCVSATYPGVVEFEGITPSTQLFNPYDTNEFIDYIKWLNQSVTDRINPYDRENFDKDSVKRNSGAFVFWWSMGYLAPPAGVTEYDCSLKMQQISLAYTGYSAAAITVLNSETEAPEAACKLVEILDNDKYLGTIMRFGEENTHWTLTDDGLLDGTIGVDSKIKYWYGHQLGDITNTILPVAEGADFGKALEDLNSSAVYSANLGFAVDASPVEAETTAIAAVYAEYLSGSNLYSGMLDEATTDAAIKDMNDKFYANGLQDVIDEYQAQLDAWRSAQ